MRRILLTPDPNALSIDQVDEVSADSLEDMAARYHVVIPADHLGDAPMLAEGIRAAFLCTDLQAFERLRTLQLPGDLLFKPSAVARLDLLRSVRRTLVTIRPIKQGETITEDDLGEILGGSGVAVEWRDQMVGRTALYDMMEGMPVDFGFLSEDPVGDNQRGAHQDDAGLGGRSKGEVL
jgi:hypothetical protein